MLFPRTAESMAITDADRRILWVNKVLKEICGIEPDLQKAEVVFSFCPASSNALGVSWILLST